MEHIKSESLLTPITNPAEHPVCIHGTYYKAWAMIRNTGLNKMKRGHIHMASQHFGSEEMISGMKCVMSVCV